MTYAFLTPKFCWHNQNEIGKSVTFRQSTIHHSSFIMKRQATGLKSCCACDNVQLWLYYNVYLLILTFSFLRFPQPWEEWKEFWSTHLLFQIHLGRLPLKSKFFILTKMPISSKVEQGFSDFGSTTSKLLNLHSYHWATALSVIWEERFKIFIVLP